MMLGRHFRQRLVWPMNLKTTLTIAALTCVATFATAETKVAMTGLHNCCGGCANGIKKAVSTVKDATVTLDGGDIEITVKRPSDAKKVIAAVMDAGYYGKTDAATETSNTSTANATKVKSATVTGVHLCCGKCVTAATKAVTSVGGVSEHTIKNKATSFEVKGDFEVAALTKALNDAGLHGKIK
jgi:copper chaperone CopZ